MQNRRLLLVSSLLVLLAQAHLYSGDVEISDEQVSYTSYVENCVKTLIEYGTGRYGY